MSERSYLLCLSGFHRLIARSIAQSLPSGTASVLNFDRATKTSDKLRKVLRLAISRHTRRKDQNPTLFIPHIYNVWFAIAASLYKNIALYDDGIAYYYNAPIPKRNRVRVYSMLARQLNHAFGGKMYSAGTYYEYLKVSNAVGYYSLFPELIGSIRPNIRRVVVEAACPDPSRESGIAVLHSPLMCAGVIEAIQRTVGTACRQQSEFRVYAKMHPRHKDNRFALAMQQLGAEMISGDWEIFLQNRRISHVICMWSSGALSAKLLQPDCCITNIYTGDGDPNLVRLFDLIQATNAQV